MSEKYTIPKINSSEPVVNKFIVPKVSVPGVVLGELGRSGELAAIAAAKARDNTSPSNPYIRGVSTNPTNTTPDSGLAYTSDLGTKVYADVTFDSVTYTDRNGNSITTPRMIFQSILVSVVFPRNIVKTKIQGRDGTVKEYIGEDDANITFTGILTGTKNTYGTKSDPKGSKVYPGGNGIYPGSQISDLMKVIKAPVAIPVICTHLQNLGF